VRLYQVVPPSASDGTPATTTTLTVRPTEDGVFDIEPVPRTISELRRKVKAEVAPSLNDVADYQLKVYEFTRSATDEIILPNERKPLSPGNEVPKVTTPLEPLMIVVPPATPTSAPPTVGQVAVNPDDPAKQIRLERAKEFAKSIMSDLKPIPESEDMQLMPNIIDIETGIERDIVIRSMNNSFWKECIQVLNDENHLFRLCVVGTPGIGKTTCTAYAIRMLLIAKKTVVYRIRGDDATGWYYEFIPRVNHPIDVNVYPETVSIHHIASLQVTSTFYIVDPGRTKKNCLLPSDFLPKYMLISSPDERHWGGSEFKKKRVNEIGKFLYYPVWDLEEIQAARTYLFPGTAKPTAEEVMTRFRQVGGVPRNIFTEVYHSALEDQVKAITALTSEQVINIVKKRMDGLGTFAEGQPKSAIIGYAKDDPHLTYSKEKIVIVSPSVADYVYVKYIQDLWNEPYSTKVFETYCRALMTLRENSKLRKLLFTRRPCVGKNDEGYQKVTRTSVGHCSESRMVPDIVKAAKEHSMVLFHSTDPRHKLYDFMYRSTQGIFYAFQATIGDKHDAPTSLMEELRKQLGSSKLEIYYMVTEEKFDKFVSKPVGPFSDDPNTTVWHLRVPKPNGIPLVGSEYLV
jgi:hypothetical protein